MVSISNRFTHPILQPALDQQIAQMFLKHRLHWPQISSSCSRLISRSQTNLQSLLLFPLASIQPPTAQ